MWKRSKADEPGEPVSDGRARDPWSMYQFIMQDVMPSEETYASQVCERMLQLARRQRASDIHLDARPDGFQFKIRVDGRLVDVGLIPHGQQVSIAARYKALAQLVTYRSDVPQEGRISEPGEVGEARLATFPTLHGERLVIRLSNTQERVTQLHDLGMSELQLAHYHHALQAAAGVLLITGPVGSGKTTAAYACLHHLCGDSAPEEVARGRCVVTLEDPVEREIPGIAQAQIDPHSGFDWDMGLKALLRQDPDVLFVGEIRDAATAQAVFRASMAGQLVISTMHARSNAEALLRLLDLHVPSQHLVSGLRLMTNQRLVRRRCSCQTGCDRCYYEGYRGRTLLCEVLPEISFEIARLITHSGDLVELQRRVSQAAGQTLNDTAQQAVAAGIVSAEDVQELLRNV